MRITALFIAAALGSVAIGVPAIAQPSPAQVEPNAVQALTRMSAYLRSIPAFQIALQTQSDDVDVYGQLITVSGGATYKVRRPDAFSIDLALPSVTGRYVSDGKTVTIYDAKSGNYVKDPASPTIRSTLELAKLKYGASVPLDDLFTWSEGDARSQALTSAHFIGKAQIAGQSASQYAFRQPGIDWQIWIADGDKPAPLRVIIIASDDPARPQFQTDLSWDTNPQFAQEAFAFAPPPSARAVTGRPFR
jgi:hypothetical protein